MMDPTYFISDLHLDASRPEMITLFADFASTEFVDAKALYILGDFFEYWVGDDQPLGRLEPVVASLQALTKTGVPIFFIAGNRDFLIGKAFALKAGITLLDDEVLLDLYGESVLVMHGDTLCTDDVEYQSMRTMLRNPDWQKEFLSLPLEARIQQALMLRERSMNETREKHESITDVSANEVHKVMMDYGVNRLIHGHTHRPAVHELGEGKTRIVLGDWYEQGSLLKVDESGYELRSLSLV